MRDWINDPPPAAKDWQLHLVKEHSNIQELSSNPEATLVLNVPKDAVGEPSCPTCKGLWALAHEQS